MENTVLHTLECLMHNSSVESEKRLDENAQVKMVQLLHDNKGIHVMGLAAILGVTKGAVSQMLSKMEKKGLVCKEKDPDKGTRLKIMLTEKGEALYEAHAAYHRELETLTATLLDGASEESRAFLAEFVDQVGRKLNEEWNIVEKFL